jgi:hypothetical protein
MKEEFIKAMKDVIGDIKPTPIGILVSILVAKNILTLEEAKEIEEEIKKL